MVGVDIEEQPNYPFRFVRADALEVTEELAEKLGVSFVHASPPCQGSSPTEAFRRRRTMRNPRTPDPVNLIGSVRDMLNGIMVPWVIENVPYRRTGLRCDLMLCGEMFGLDVFRHRWFEFGGGAPVPSAPPHPAHRRLAVRNGYLPTEERPVMTVTGRNGHHSRAWVVAAANALGVGWLSDDLNATCEAIPPAYTGYIGRHLVGGVS